MSKVVCMTQRQALPESVGLCNCAELEQARARVAELTEAAAMRAARERRLLDKLEQARVQLAGCLTAAEGATGKYGGTLAYQGDYGWSLAYQRVLELRMKYEKATHAT